MCRNAETGGGEMLRGPRLGRLGPGGGWYQTGRGARRLPSCVFWVVVGVLSARAAEKSTHPSYLVLHPEPVPRQGGLPASRVTQNRSRGEEGQQGVPGRGNPALRFAPVSSPL